MEYTPATYVYSPADLYSMYYTGSDKYAFVEFVDSASATVALNTLNKRLVMGKEMKVNWASQPNNAPKQDTSKHYHVFVGDLSSDIEPKQLRDAFHVYGEISDCKVIKDPATDKSKGYGFVTYVNKQDAEQAIAGMNNQWLGHRPIRTNWASRKPTAPIVKENAKPLIYEDVFGLSSATNCTVYCGGVTNGLTEELMRKTFNQYGTIQEVRVFKEKGFAFIRFSTKEAATQAICGVHASIVNEQQVKCSWGKESNDSNSNKQQTSSSPPVVMVPSQQQAPLATASYAAGQFYNMGYYPATHAGAPAAAAYPTAAAAGYQSPTAATATAGLPQSQYIPAAGPAGQWPAATYSNYQAYGSMNVPGGMASQYAGLQFQPGQHQQFNGQPPQGLMGYPMHTLSGGTVTFI